MFLRPIISGMPASGEIPLSKNQPRSPACPPIRGSERRPLGECDFGHGKVSGSDLSRRPRLGKHGHHHPHSQFEDTSRSRTIPVHQGWPSLHQSFELGCATGRPEMSATRPESGLIIS